MQYKAKFIITYRQKHDWRRTSRPTNALSSVI